MKMKYSGNSNQCAFSFMTAKEMAPQHPQKNGLMRVLEVTRVDCKIAKNAIITKTNSKPDHQNGIKSWQDVAQELPAINKNGVIRQ